MSVGSERVEGQALAAAILTALDPARNGGKMPDWTSFVTAYRSELTDAATRLNKKYRGLQGFEPEDIVQSFFARKVFPPERARVMLSPVARGEQPLKPRLLTSLGTFCIDLHRGEKRQPILTELVIDPPAAPTNRLSVEEVESIITRQFRAIRETFDNPETRAPYRGTLLLAQRIEWVWILTSVVLSGADGRKAVALGVERIVALTAWNEAEAAQLLGDAESGVPLREAWE